MRLDGLTAQEKAAAEEAVATLREREATTGTCMGCGAEVIAAATYDPVTLGPHPTEKEILDATAVVAEDQAGSYRLWSPATNSPAGPVGVGVYRRHQCPTPEDPGGSDQT